MGRWLMRILTFDHISMMVLVVRQYEFPFLTCLVSLVKLKAIHSVTTVVICALLHTPIHFYWAGQAK